MFLDLPLTSNGILSNVYCTIRSQPKKLNLSLFTFKFDFFQMASSSYPSMAQSFSMSHGAANMSAAVTGMRQDAMGNDYEH